MRKVLLPAALLLLLAASAVLAAVPPSVWFQYNFDTYGGNPVAAGRLCWAPGWQEAQVVEPGMTSPWATGTTDVNVASGIAACSGTQYAIMKGYQGNWGGKSLTDPAAACAETNRAAPPTGVSWETSASGSVQILYFKMKRAFDELASPPLHAGVYLMDNNAFGAQPIMGWAASTHGIKPQLNLPTYPGAGLWTTNQYYSPEGTFWAWSPLDSNCQAFTATYDPATGDVKFYIDSISLTTPLWTGNAGAGRVSRSIYVRDYGWHGGSLVDAVLLDDLAVGTTAKPVVTAPINEAFVTTATPTISWTPALGSGRVSYEVKICASDSSSAAAVTNGSSGVLTGSSNSWTPSGPLPTNTHLYAFVQETYAGPTGWSLTGNKGFYITTAVPPAPTVTAPAGEVVGAKPQVTFTATPHDHFQVKITTTSDGGGLAEWLSNEIASLQSGAACPVTLSPGTPYYAFARAKNPIGWGAWSAASAFTVSRVGEGKDIRNMDEVWGAESVLDHNAAAPNDGFNEYCGGGRVWQDIKRQVLPDPFNLAVDSNGAKANYQPTDWWPNIPPVGYDPGYWIMPPNPNRAAPSYVADFWDTDATWNSNDIRLHRVADVSLDRGVTFLTLAAGKCYEGVNCGGHTARKVAQEAQMYIMDDYGTGKCMASFRYGQGQVGICNDTATWHTAGYTDEQVPDRPGQGWHVVRITGRNAISGDPTSTVWKYYLDENTVPLLDTSAAPAYPGSMDQSVAPYGSIVDGIAIGQGDGGLVGNWQYDWTAVNTGGDYGPGEWWPLTMNYASISAAIADGRMCQAVIAGDAVITAVQYSGGSQIGFWVQDVNSKDRKNILILSTDPTNVEVGHKVTGISGLYGPEGGVGGAFVQAVPALKVPSCTVTTTHADATPLAMNQKALGGLGLVDQFGAGTSTTAMFVRIVGRLTDCSSDAIYIDDGSGLLDGRQDPNSTALGVRIAVPNDFDNMTHPFVQIDGIAATEHWVEANHNSKVRTIVAPTYTVIDE